MQHHHRIVIVDRLINDQTIRGLLPLKNRGAVVPLRPLAAIIHPTRTNQNPKPKTQLLKSKPLRPIASTEEKSYGSEEEEEVASPGFAIRTRLPRTESGRRHLEGLARSVIYRSRRFIILLILENLPTYITLWVPQLCAFISEGQFRVDLERVERVPPRLMKAHHKAHKTR